MITTEPKLNLEHRTHQHCESGAIANLYNFYGISLSEAMVFGIGAGLFFVHTNLIKALNAPVTSFRYFPGKIFKTVSESLGVKCAVKTFGNASKGMQALDQQLMQGKPVGLFTNMYHLDYMPDIFRFDFSAHNLIVYGKEGDKYYVSDSIIEFPVTISAAQLAKARFGKGFLGAKGRMYYVEKTNPNPPIEQAIVKGINKVCNRMLHHILPGIGCKGIHQLANNIAKYPKKLSVEKASFYLVNLIRMQEVTGTGGSGYRVLYTQFLKEAAEALNNPKLLICAEELSNIAADWKQFALQAGRCAKAHIRKTDVTYQSLSQLLHQIADKEFTFYHNLQKAVK